jgi:hypothetical protein
MESAPSQNVNAARPFKRLRFALAQGTSGTYLTLRRAYSLWTAQPNGEE